MRGLFWKILLAFWLSSSLIVISGGLITALEFAHERQRWSYSKNVEKYAQKIIHRWEASQESREQFQRKEQQRLKQLKEKAKRQILEPRERRDFLYQLEQEYRQRHDHWQDRHDEHEHREYKKYKRRWKKLPPLLLRDADSGQVLWGKRALNTMPHIETIEVESRSGRRYLLSYPEAKRLSALPVALRQLFSLRLLAALVLSSLFSLILSLILTRPINRLKQHIDQMAAGNLDLELEQRLTQRRDEIGSLASSFETMSKRLNDMLESKQKLLNDVSHELRAPLARLQVAAAMIEETPTDQKEQAELADRIQQECVRLDHLIGQILDYSKLSQQQNQSRSEIDLESEIELAINNARFLAPQREFVFDNKLGGQATIFAVSSRVNQILENLLSNAIKYGEGSIEVQAQQHTEQQLVVTVRDHGPGFEPEAISKLTEPFTRGHQTANEIKGFGLGLSIVQKACELENIELTLDNHPRGGAQAKLVFSQ